MSFDPYGYDPEKPKLPPDAVQPPPDGTAPIAYQAGMVPAVDTQARERAMLPGIFLIVLGVLNLLWVLFLGYMGVSMMFLTPEQLAEAKRQMTPEQRKQYTELEGKMKEAGYTMETFAATMGKGFLITGGICLIASLIMIFGGVCMVQLRFFGLCVFASLVTAVPFVSGAACCCLGEGIGIWGAGGAADQ